MTNPTDFEPGDAIEVVRLALGPLKQTADAGAWIRCRVVLATRTDIAVEWDGKTINVPTGRGWLRRPR